MLFQRSWSRRLFVGAGLGLCVAAIAVANLGHAADRVASSDGVEVLPFDPNASCEATNQADRRFRKVAVEVLGETLAREAIATLGEAEPVQESAPPLDCSCSRQSDWCAAGADCESLACNVVAGCGTFWAYQCDGLCYRDQS